MRPVRQFDIFKIVGYHAGCNGFAGRIEVMADKFDDPENEVVDEAVELAKKGIGRLSMSNTDDVNNRLAAEISHPPLPTIDLSLHGVLAQFSPISSLEKK
jgi:hypothetical protein